MQTSEQINEVATALAKVQAELKNPAFDSNNPAFKSKYASLASVRDAIVPALTKHGLSLMQNVASCDNVISCTNRLMHTSGQWIESDAFCVPADKHNAHGYGSACTYARRFSLMAFMAVVGDEDDDGNAAVAAAPTKPAKPTFKLDMKIVDKFTAATTLDEVAAVWNSIDVGLRANYAEIKDAAKEKVANA
jgi:hypothetical protein